MAALRCWPGCLAEFRAGTTNQGRQVVVLQLHEPASAFLGMPVWSVQPLQQVRTMSGQLRVPGDGMETPCALDADLVPLQPIPDTETVEQVLEAARGDAVEV